MLRGAARPRSRTGSSIIAVITNFYMLIFREYKTKLKRKGAGNVLTL